MNVQMGVVSNVQVGMAGMFGNVQMGSPWSVGNEHPGGITQLGILGMSRWGHPAGNVGNECPSGIRLGVMGNIQVGMVGMGGQVGSPSWESWECRGGVTQMGMVGNVQVGSLLESWECLGGMGNVRVGSPSRE